MARPSANASRYLSVAARSCRGDLLRVLELLILLFERLFTLVVVELHGSGGRRLRVGSGVCRCDSGTQESSQSDTCCERRRAQHAFQIHSVNSILYPYVAAFAMTVRTLTDKIARILSLLCELADKDS